MYPTDWFDLCLGWSS